MIATVMGLSFLALLFLQLSYIEEMVKMKKEQFDESVKRSLYQASRHLELNETLRYLEKDVNRAGRRAARKDSVNGQQGDAKQIPVEVGKYEAWTDAQRLDTSQRQECYFGGIKVDEGDS